MLAFFITFYVFVPNHFKALFGYYFVFTHGREHSIRIIVYNYKSYAFQMPRTKSSIIMDENDNNLDPKCM